MDSKNESDKKVKKNNQKEQKKELRGNKKRS